MQSFAASKHWCMNTLSKVGDAHDGHRCSNRNPIESLHVWACLPSDRVLPGQLVMQTSHCRTAPQFWSENGRCSSKHAEILFDRNPADRKCLAVVAR
eukprot:354641-Chlamydomonas_euryale.AAC.1